MRNITLESKFGFILDQADKLDENGNVVSTSYDIIDSDGNIIEHFGTLREAQNYFKTVTTPKSSRPKM